MARIPLEDYRGMIRTPGCVAASSSNNIFDIRSNNRTVTVSLSDFTAYAQLGGCLVLDYDATNWVTLAENIAGTTVFTANMANDWRANHFANGINLTLGIAKPGITMTTYSRFFSRFSAFKLIQFVKAPGAPLYAEYEVLIGNVPGSTTTDQAIVNRSYRRVHIPVVGMMWTGAGSMRLSRNLTLKWDYVTRSSLWEDQDGWNLATHALSMGGDPLTGIGLGFTGVQRRDRLAEYTATLPSHLPYGHIYDDRFSVSEKIASDISWGAIDGSTLTAAPVVTFRFPGNGTIAFSFPWSNNPTDAAPPGHHLVELSATPYYPRAGGTYVSPRSAADVTPDYTRRNRLHVTTAPTVDDGTGWIEGVHTETEIQEARKGEFATPLSTSDGAFFHEGGRNNPFPFMGLGNQVSDVIGRMTAAVMYPDRPLGSNPDGLTQGAKITWEDVRP